MQSKFYLMSSPSQFSQLTAHSTIMIPCKIIKTAKQIAHKHMASALRSRNDHICLCRPTKSSRVRRDYDHAYSSNEIFPNVFRHHLLCFGSTWTISLASYLDLKIRKNMVNLFIPVIYYRIEIQIIWMKKIH